MLLPWRSRRFGCRMVWRASSIVYIGRRGASSRCAIVARLRCWVLWRLRVVVEMLLLLLLRLCLDMVVPLVLMGRALQRSNLVSGNHRRVNRQGSGSR